MKKLILLFCIFGLVTESLAQFPVPPYGQNLVRGRIGGSHAMGTTVIDEDTTNFYISPTGNDLATGNTDSHAWQTIVKLNTKTLEADDTVFFKAGGTYTTKLVVSGSGTAGNTVVFTSYGVGAAPIISNGIDTTGKTYITVAGLNVIDGDRYFLASGGNDSYSGLSVWSPFKTIAKLNTVTYVANDTASFNKGDTFAGQVNVAQSGTAGSPIVLTSYGTGNKPIIKGSETLTTWVQNGSIWACKATTDIKNIFVGGVQMTKARSPNSGWYGGWKPKFTTSTTGFSADSLTQANDYWNGGTIHFRPAAYYSDTAYVTDFIAATDSLVFSSSNTIPPAYSFFIDNVFATLDSAGEWYCNTATDSVYLMAPAGANPNTLTVEGTTQNYGIYASGKNFITIDGLEIKYPYLAGVYSTGNATNWTVQNCNVNSGYGTGIFFDGTPASQRSANILISNDTIKGWNVDGIVLVRSDTTTVSGNTVKNIYFVPGYGNLVVSAQGQGRGIVLGTDAYNSTKNLISGNTVDSIGYTGIQLRGMNSKVQNNLVSNFMLNSSDGGGIYLYSEARTGVGPDYTYGTYNNSVNHNILWNGNASAIGATGMTLTCNALYNDGRSFRNSYDTNTVYQHNEVALFIQYACDSINVRGNTFYKVGHEPTILAVSDTTQPVAAPVWNKHVFKYNTYWPAATSNYGVSFQLNNDTIPLYISSLDSNYWGSLTAAGNVFLKNNVGGGYQTTYYTLAAWKTAMSQDANSKPIFVDGYAGKDSLFINKTNATVNHTLTHKFMDLDGANVASPFALAAYSSRVLLSDSVSAIKDSLKAYWSMNEASGATRVDVVNANDATLVGTVTAIAGKKGNAAQGVTGLSTSYLAVPETATMEMRDTSMTMAMWLHIDSLVVAKSPDFFYKDGAFAGALSEAGVMSFTCNGTTLTRSGFVAGGTYYVVFWYDTANDSMFMQIDNGAITGKDCPTHPDVYGLGMRLVGGQYNHSICGWLDEVGYWRRVLTSSERTWLYNSSMGRAWSEF